MVDRKRAASGDEEPQTPATEVDPPSTLAARRVYAALCKRYPWLAFVVRGKVAPGATPIGHVLAAWRVLDADPRGWLVERPKPIPEHLASGWIPGPRTIEPPTGL